MDQKQFESISQEIIQAGQRIYQKGFVAANDGNISARVGEQQILITPSGRSKGFLKLEDLVLVDLNGKIIHGNLKPSSETAMHLTIYQEREDVNSVCHAHPVYATAFSVATIPLDEPVLPEVIVTLGRIPMVPYAEPGSPDVSKNIRPFLAHHDAFLLANHGAVTVGKDVFDAFYKMETVEHFARILHKAKQLGSVHLLKSEEVQALIRQRSKWQIREGLNSDFIDTAKEE